jgi:SagB-type dehydrogenase family enzyme
VCRSLQSYYPYEAAEYETSRLISLGFITIQNTYEAEIDEKYEKQWAWGNMAGYYHFGIKDPYYMNPEETTAWLDTQIKAKPDVPLYETNENYTDVVSLPPPDMTPQIFATMLARRSYRGFNPNAAVSLQALQQCLFSGLGIVGFIKTSMPGMGLLPMKMTPSGGGRNPYEAYVMARNVEGLAPGIYHYSAVDHTLGLVTNANLPKVGDMLAVQPWFDNAAALIMLVANFERTMWKYPHPTGFRVVLLEAGHIAQNMLLAATALGLASAPTCAVSDGLITQLLNLDPVTQSAVYTVSIGHSSGVPTQADVTTVIANDKLRM